ncbi:DMT family transporter [Apilactobacillus ozensis]|uniref:Multidrug transporter EmrE n=1 Tax=Apilactobacillus ozensis DSM 23829 = JCM 17196 TaxID=1423781 RepID=A0A0R2B4C3_9LACO|nr:multidrug efflux SMR transporter [Apilactobacillus ozensis]KRM69948.1 hypothetical protein FD06_GL000115 [Apilactobacillus ozensis DSM 23829 = JCM 17196]MCK8606838.1 multidrug efflux SMR transporter [Apilactobacillus ozensis]
MYYYVFLLLAILGELVGTNLLKISMGFSKLLPTIGSLLSFAVCFYCLSIAMIKVPLNIAYATWSGIGLLLSTVVAVILYKEAINISTIIGLTLIIVGVVILNLYSTK